MSDLIEAMRRIENSLVERRAKALDAGNTSLASKWEKELVAFKLPSHVQAIEALGVEPQVFDGLAIYAVQKVRKIVQAFLGIGRIDPYTATIMRNAMTRSGYVLTARNILGSLDRDHTIAENDSLVYRRVAKSGTAQTQASSSKAALVALKIGTLRKEGRGYDLVIDPQHPFITRLKENSV